MSSGNLGRKPVVRTRRLLGLFPAGGVTVLSTWKDESHSYLMRRKGDYGRAWPEARQPHPHLQDAQEDYGSEPRHRQLWVV